MPHILKTAFHQNPNVGLYGYANDKFCLLAAHIPRKVERQIEEVLKVPIIKTNICGTSLVGVFAAGNNQKLLLPHIVLDPELQKLESANIKYKILLTDHTALGNNIVASDSACLISPELESQKTEIKKFLGVKKIKTFAITEMPTIGSLVVINNKACIVSKLASDEELNKIQKFFSLPTTHATINLGSPYISSGIIANSHGFVFGNKTGGPEAIHLDTALGFLE